MEVQNYIEKNLLTRIIFNASDILRTPENGEPKTDLLVTNVKSIR